MDDYVYDYRTTNNIQDQLHFTSSKHDKIQWAVVSHEFKDMLKTSSRQSVFFFFLALSVFMFLWTHYCL